MCTITAMRLPLLDHDLSAENHWVIMVFALACYTLYDTGAITGMHTIIATGWRRGAHVVTAMRTTVTTARIYTYVWALTVLSMTSALIRYAISIDPMATTCMCFAMGLLSCIPCMTHVRNQAIAGALLCVLDVFEYHVHTIAPLTLKMAGYLSKISLNSI